MLKVSVRSHFSNQYQPQLHQANISLSTAASGSSHLSKDLSHVPHSKPSGAGGSSKIISVDLETETFSDFLHKCSEVLNVKAKRVFASHGQPIHMLPDLINQEHYYITEVSKE